MEDLELNKIHYVCMGGCGFVSNDRVRCATMRCIRSRNPLTECRCRNSKHKTIRYLNVK